MKIKKEDIQYSHCGNCIKVTLKNIDLDIFCTKIGVCGDSTSETTIELKTEDNFRVALLHVEKDEERY